MRLPTTALAISIAALISGCDQEIPPERMKSGEDLYNYYCKNCHETRGPGARMEHFRGKKPMKPYKVILMIKYGYSTEQHSMPMFSQLSEEQADAVARYAISLQRAE